MNLETERAVKLKILTHLYYSKPRTDSLPRFIRRLGRGPKYQALLRSAHRRKRFEAMGHLEACEPGKCSTKKVHEKIGDTIVTTECKVLERKIAGVRR